MGRIICKNVITAKQSQVLCINTYLTTPVILLILNWAFLSLYQVPLKCHTEHATAEGLPRIGNISQKSSFCNPCISCATAVHHQVYKLQYPLLTSLLSFVALHSSFLCSHSSQCIILFLQGISVIIHFHHQNTFLWFLTWRSPVLLIPPWLLHYISQLTCDTRAFWYLAGTLVQMLPEGFLVWKPQFKRDEFARFVHTDDQLICAQQ